MSAIYSSSVSSCLSAYHRVAMIANQLTSSTDSSHSASAPSSAPDSSLYSSRQLPLLSHTGSTSLTNAKIDSIVTHSIARLQDFIPDLQLYPNVFARRKLDSKAKFPVASQAHAEASDSAPLSALDGLKYNQLISDGEMVLLDIVRRDESGGGTAKAFVRAGPREKIVWKPGEVIAALVTCGGLCPGLNDVLAELFSTLYYNYGVDKIYGIRSGFRGFWDSQFRPFQLLTPERMRGIYEQGGTMLGSSRGGFNLNEIIDACIEHGINQVYVVGGDGTHRAANLLQQEAIKRKLKMVVAGVPKTIDNDIGCIDRSFGFNTAVHEARKAIQSAVVEASCIPRGLGVVQVMGRHAGYIAAHATLASRQVDLCLIPEVPFPLVGPNGVLELTEQILDRQGYGVIVVAEGAGADLCAASSETDESGNKRLPEIGRFLHQQIQKHFKSKGKEISIKYHDPSYMIRSVPADASDSIYCSTLAQNAVHGAMAGFTGFTSGLVNNRTVLLPIPLITATSPSYLNPEGRTWERVLSLTHQPNWKDQKPAVTH